MRREDRWIRSGGGVASGRWGRCLSPCLCRARRIASAFAFCPGLWTLDAGPLTVFALDAGLSTLDTSAGTVSEAGEGV